MKIAVSSTGPTLADPIDSRFGRCAFFILVDPATMDFEVVENNQSLDLPQGAGIQAGKTVADNKVAALITGHCGPKAFKVLQAAGVKIMTGASGKIADAIAQYKNRDLEPANQEDVEGHWV